MLQCVCAHWTNLFDHYEVSKQLAPRGSWISDKKSVTFGSGDSSDAISQISHTSQIFFRSEHFQCFVYQQHRYGIFQQHGEISLWLAAPEYTGGLWWAPCAALLNATLCHLYTNKHTESIRQKSIKYMEKCSVPSKFL